MTGDVLHIDGSFGEGGGQILRTSLALALVAGRPFHIDRVRARRKKPGLQRQHLASVRAAAEVGQASVEGAELGSMELAFAPGAVRPGEYRFDVGSAGSTTLVLQTVLPALLTAAGPSQVRIIGGTHNPMAPPVDFLHKAFLPLVCRMGPRVEIELERYGFYPAGGGSLLVRIEPRPALARIELLDRGRVEGHAIRAVVARLPRHIAEREADTARRKLGWDAKCATVEEVESDGPGNVVSVEVRSRHVTEVFTGFGQLRVPAEKVAAGAAKQARRYLEAGVPVSEHLADQLLIPMALAGGGRFRTQPPTEHTRTNIEIVKRFLDVEIRAEPVEGDAWQIEIEGRGPAALRPSPAAEHGA
jgi:RNA 3'-terminal phosphate cyclase (ATP)